MTIFISILHVVSEKKIFEISVNQRLLWPLAAILDNRSEQKVTTIDQHMSGRFLSSMVPIHPVVLEKKFVLQIFNSILHVVSEKKILKNFSQSEAFMAPGSHVG
jgi:hypothetical protein